MSTTAFGLGSKYFALYEVAGVGIQWHTFSQSPVEGDDFNLLLAVTMLMVDTVVYGVLTWYIEAVHPGTGLSAGDQGGTRSLGFCLSLGGIWPLWWMVVTPRPSVSSPLLDPQVCMGCPGPGTSRYRSPIGWAVGGQRPGSGAGRGHMHRASALWKRTRPVPWRAGTSVRLGSEC